MDYQLHTLLGLLHDFVMVPNKENPFPALYQFLRRLACGSASLTIPW